MASALIPACRFVLVRPQLGENIGKAARAMLNFGQSEMVLVAPRDGWPNPSAGPAASGADAVLDAARVVPDVRTAIADCGLVFASTVRPRGMTKPVVTGVDAAQQAQEAVAKGVPVAFLFGPERSGLENDDIVLADKILTVPLNPAFSSLNLAQAVLLVAYELFNKAPKKSEIDQRIASQTHELAPKEAVFGLVDHLLARLGESGFFRSEDRRDVQQRMIYNLIQNAGMSAQDVQTWRGILKSLTVERGSQRRSSDRDKG